MTVHSERVNAIINTKEFLLLLIDRKATPRVPLSIRQKAYRLLRHYPSEYDIKDVLKTPKTKG